MKVEIKGDRATVHTRPTPKLLAVLPSLEGQRRWLKAGGLSIAASGHNLDLLRSAFPDIDIESDSKGVCAAAEEFDEGLPPYEPKTAPYPHQVAALEKCRTKASFALFLEQGVGKSKVAIDRAGELHAEGRITGVLVVAKKGVHRQWIESQVPEHMGCEWRGHYWETPKVVPASSDDGQGLDWFAINFDGAKTPKGKAACLDFIDRHKGKVLIIADETQEIKNSRSARHKAMEELKRASASPYRLALTGTPIAKDLTDEWAQLKWLDERILGQRYVSAFRNEYCIMGGFEGRVVVGHKNIERFREKVDPFTFRATKDEIGILPKAYRRWDFSLTRDQKRAIVQIKQDLSYQLQTGEISSVANAAVAMSKVQQISNGFFTDEDGRRHQLMPPAKNPRLGALLECLAAYDGKAIVWARFREDIRLIAEALKAEGITFAEYHGGTPDKERAAAVESFLAPDGVRIFLSNPQAGGTGLNLQGGCNHAIYYSNGFNAIDRWQSEDRIHRIGTNGNVVYTDLACKGAIDYHILSNLKRKKGISDLALGDIAAWAKQEEEEL